MLGKHIIPCEDSLTAGVFSHLLHLPAELFWQIIRDACYTDRLPVNSGEILDAVFWPAWDASGTGNAARVIPDLFIRFTQFDLIIEAKRRDDGMQDHRQWRRELAAYVNEYGHEGLQVKMIALGGLHTRKDDEIVHLVPVASAGSCDITVNSRSVNCPVHMCRWRSLLDQSKKMHRDLSRLSFQSSQTKAHVRVLAHTIDLFGCHGFSTGLWFSDFDFSGHRIGMRAEHHLDFFRQRSQSLPHA